MREPWTPEQDEELKRLWPKYSASAIAPLLHRNRNSVIGRAHRLGLTKSLSTKPVGEISPPRYNHQNYKNKTGTIRPVENIGTRLVIEPNQEQNCTVPLLDAKWFQCKAVMDGQRDAFGLAVVCGKRIEEGQSFSFCSEHLQIFTSRGRQNEYDGQAAQQLHADSQPTPQAAQRSTG